MKKYFEGNTTLEDLKEAVLRIQKNEDRRGLYIFIGVITTIIIATIVGVALILNKKILL